jgi:hypothetical protein
MIAQRKGKAEMKSQKQELLNQMQKVEDIFNDASLSWEEKYDTIFKLAPEIRSLTSALCIYLDYYDPDTSNQEDVSAYVEALLAERPALQEEEEPRFQFFTTDQNLIVGTWYPMDHFFYAPYNWDGQQLIEEGRVVHLEGHASIRNESGFSISVIQGEGEASVSEEFDDYPSALRRMADVIEAHTKSIKKG